VVGVLFCKKFKRKQRRNMKRNEQLLLGSRVDHPSEEQKDTQDNVSHKARFISSQLGSGYPPDAVGFNTDPEYKTQAAFIFF
jgi:hypothetical protein